MTPEQKNEQYLEEQRKVLEYEGKIPRQPYVWNCPSCFNMNVEMYKTYKVVCNTCKARFHHDK